MKLNLNIPKSWNELSTRQLKKIAKLLDSNIKGTYFDYKVFAILLNARWFKVWKLWKLVFLVNNVAFSEFKKEYCAWFYEKIGLTTFIPTIKVKDKLLQSPADRITNLTIDEFAHADDLYIGWINKHQLQHIHYLAAVLYRELDENGKKVPFDKTELDERAKLFKKIDRKTLLTIVLSYQGCRSHLESKFKYVFPKSKSLETAKKSTAKSSGFGKVIMQIARSGNTFGAYDQTRTTNLYVFLSEYDELLRIEKQRPK